MVKTNSKTYIKDRKSENLTKPDRANIKSCLVDLMLRKNWLTVDLPSNEEIFGDLLPMLAYKNPDWAGITHTRELKGTEVWSRTLQVIKNERHADDDKLDKKVALKRAILKAEESDENTSEDKTPEKINTPNKKEKTQKGKHDVPQITDKGPLPDQHLEVLKNQTLQDDVFNGIDLVPSKRPWTAQHATLINNEIELELAVTDLRACKAKLKGASKRVDELKKLRRALMVDPDVDSE